ncbi:PLD nuclease N-terminal domain-containing protein [Brevibacterium sp. UCMA 11752]|uniref:PLD nuclease N-terminal domain-containing protein n=1 Tax=Brevibacterium sp. UCMA 11752 TaxID=2745946 RepID=UPI001F15EAF3|nr:PLD nuclease N-terminal domain-containing protein [Brevibacterium sp. UCMA 11752]MCF2588968.1 PLDc_N domain-containing protein [Brevibacterium sp. UCMA 11752]
MARILIAAIVLAAAVTLYGLFDCLLRDRGLIRVLPKPVWAIIILLIPVIGFVLWYLFGRGTEDKPSAAPRQRGPSAPDDDDDYLRKVDRDVKLGKHAPEAQKPEDKTPDAADDIGDDASADSDTHSADTDEHGSGGSTGDGRGHSN